ncbi:unnamed protein product [Rotaria magnacalcarata]|uniref:Uncharacterized protein n=1 Tax=Rotaria magnacalcarata TaxID=392030 RepID=A0A815Z9R0_9BILA|nr:unnamed protein product [Rotaria magnacalcarata]CAF3977317.1 unnamed protein product [Rotaria magnacalcarata]
MESWCMYQLVDDIYFEKSQEMDTLIEQNQGEFVDHKIRHLEMMMKIQGDVKQLVEDGDATYEQVQLVKAPLTNVEKAMGLFQKQFHLHRCSNFWTGSLENVNDHANKKTNERPHGAQALSPNFGSRFGCSPLGNPKRTLFSPTTSTATASPPIFGFGAPTHGTIALAPFGSASTTTTTATLFSFGAIKSETSGFSFCSQPSATPTFTVSTFENKDVTIKADPRWRKN